MYSCIFAFNLRSESDSERNSTTKSGQSGGNFSCSFSESRSHLSLLTHATSGERFAPFGRVNKVEESKPRPVPSFFVHAQKQPVNSKFLMPVFPPVGDRMIKSPALVSSMRNSLLSMQNSK